MAIPTVFDITFGCGHAGQVDAADRAADQRGPWIAYLSSKGMCPDCFEATRDKRRELAHTKWIAERRKEEEVAIGAWEGEVRADHPDRVGHAPELDADDFDPVSTLVGAWGWRLATDSDDLWDVVRSWPAVADGAIPVVTAR